MKILLIHHHLNPGGVTRVMETQCEALRRAGVPVCVLVGSDSGHPPIGDEMHIIPELNYLSAELDATSLEGILERLQKSIFEHIDNHTVVHVHNLNLGKNPLLNLVLRNLLDGGVSVMNHCHDFAEDRRPKNMALLHQVIESFAGLELEDVLYPSAELPCRYAVINAFDRTRLEGKGVPSEHILDLPNAIAPPGEDPGNARSTIDDGFATQGKDLWVYPVRVIRRKNIGEALFLLALRGGSTHLLVTQPPKNPDELPSYEAWLEFCEEVELPVTFGAGQKMDFETLMYGADAMISTSSHEGFGMAFLEPWTYGKPVLGRDLPELTSGFKAKGLQFPSLYSELLWEDQDFASLSDEEQRCAITAVLEGDVDREAFLEQASLTQATTSNPPIHHNRTCIDEQYSVQAYGETLKHFYGSSF